MRNPFKRQQIISQTEIQAMIDSAYERGMHDGKLHHSDDLSKALKADYDKLVAEYLKHARPEQKLKSDGEPSGQTNT
jgi:hypothetical protein